MKKYRIQNLVARIQKRRPGTIAFRFSILDFDSWLLKSVFEA